MGENNLTPRIDTVWRARDGRRFRVLGTMTRGIPPDTHVGVLLLSLPPVAKRQRRTTEIFADNFGGAGFFLQQEAENGQ